MRSTAKNNRGSITATSISKLHLDNANKGPPSSATTQKSQETKPPPTSTSQHCGSSRNYENVSEQTLSIQNLEFPTSHRNDDKARYKVKHTSNLLQRTQSKSTPSPKERGYDFTSSSNSHFDNNWVFPIPKKFRPKCSSTSTTEERDRYQNIPPSLRSAFESSESQDRLVTSQEMIDSHHRHSHKPKHFNGPEWRKPCEESFVAGAPRKLIGTCPPNIEQIAKMSKARQKFFLTQDPRKVHCLVNPELLRSKSYSKEKEFNTLTKMVKQAQNVCGGAASESSESFICEVVDLENPLQLDFQGLDYKNTYQQDEQDLENQRIYRRVERFIERKRVKAETRVNVEEELHLERVQVPKCFNIQDRNTPRIPTPPAEPIKLGQLIRSGDKTLNRQLLDMEKGQRRERYKNLYLANKDRQDQQNETIEKLQRQREENLGLNTAEANFKKIVIHIDDLIERTFKKDKLLRQPSVQQRMFPQTIHGTQLLKGKLIQRNREHRDGEARVKQEFHRENFGVSDLELKTETPRHSSDASKLTDHASDDEANMEKVGKVGGKFKLSNKMRGQDKQRDTQQHAPIKEMGCISRDQWLKELAPKREKVKLDVGMGIQKLRSPDDPKLILFDPNFGYRPPKKEHSAVREFRLKPLGRHYDRVLRKNLKFIKPRLRYTVKKFNLIGYRFGDRAKRLALIENPVADSERAHLQLSTTDEYIQAKALKEQRRQQEIKQKRLQLLGLPCKPIRKSRLQTKCENSSSSSDSEWVPEKEADLEPNDNENTLILRKEGRPAVKESMPLSGRTNMPAPKYREPTLRQHPRRPRDYKNQRVPSEIFDQVVHTTGVPHMYKLPPDMIEHSNVALEKRPYTDMFEARHHHDHWNPTQQKQVDVHYQPVLVKPQITEVKRKYDQVAMENFRLANPPCNKFVDMNLTMPECDIDAIVRDYRKTKKKEVSNMMGTIKIENLCHQQDFILRSRDPEELKQLNYPGRQEYLQFLNEVKTAVLESKQTEDPKEKLYVNKAARLQELEEELKSIESCLTSLSSSECTNFTNDSGSFLLMEGREKIPLDFLRKSLVPFEELQRSRFRAVPIDVDQEDANPFRVLPFSGQRKAQLELTTPKDSFFTFNTRLKNGLRLRLEVPVDDERQKLIGKGPHKYKGVVATDSDENYVQQLKVRPSVKTFNFKTCRSFIKDALRLKFESMLIQGQMVRTEIYDRLNEQHWAHMQQLKLLYEQLFDKWEKEEYDASMAVVYKVKAFYDETDRLKHEFRELEREQVTLNMDIVFIEGHWIRCVMLQNFHYLLGDQEWRIEHDWIHRLPCAQVVDDEAEDEVPAAELENFEDSIMKRSRVNVRQREKDDAWAIKAFYEEVYLQNKHPNLIVFPDADSFLLGLENLKTKTFVLLLEMHFTLAIHTELQGKLETFVEWCAQDLKEKQEYVARKCGKLYFMEDRANWLRRRSLVYLDQPIAETFNEDVALKDRAVISETWRRIVPANMRGSSEQVQPVDMVAMISDVVIDLISKFELIPMEESRIIESKLRVHRNYLRKQSHHACHVERRIEQEMKKVIRNLEPPYRKPKRPSKLPRLHIKKRSKPVIVQEKKISERAKFFFQAFHEDGADIMQPSDIRDSIAQVDTIQEQIVPFYFDHFLKLNGYTPNYNFKTQVEMRDGPELERLKVRAVIPEIQERMLQWEAMKRKIMEDHIGKNPKMYINVV